ncbi:hypothetical protein SAMN05880590_101365 [Rhizobium sp. RU35A]|uniref:hypothetical protein n=1 Tax=Rhizobium sp. RU35A TaxID=1907414 RepID=UPI000956E87B|nr:hypothetical protein [Rhizobium sp. RU35A]SIP94595.1 hypothetical protein SAMN05880590_101365 [Rhizobium sp. RU35A]
MKKMYLVISLSLLASCSIFVPTYDEVIYQKISAVNDDLDKINAAASKVYAAPPAFSKVESYYVDATANLDGAIEVAEGRATYLKSRISGRPAEIVATALKTCQTTLQAQLEAHRKAALNADTLAVFAAKEACAIPRVMENRLK